MIDVFFHKIPNDVTINSRQIFNKCTVGSLNKCHLTFFLRGTIPLHVALPVV